MSILNSTNILILNLDLAQIIGSNEAIILQQIHYWINKNQEENRNFKDGTYWTYNTIKDWHLQFPFISEITLKRILKKLKDMDLIKIQRFNKFKYDRTNWYTVNYSKVDQLIISN